MNKFLIISYINYCVVSINNYLTLSTNFGYEPVSFIINKHLHEFIDDVNVVILTIRNDLTLENVCKKYYKDFDQFVCSLS